MPLWCIHHPSTTINARTKNETHLLVDDIADLEFDAAGQKEELVSTTSLLGSARIGHGVHRNMMSLLPLLTFALGVVGTSGLAVLGGLGIVAGLGGTGASIGGIGDSRHGTGSDAGAHDDTMRCGVVDVAGSGVSSKPQGGFGELCCGGLLCLPHAVNSACLAFTA